MANTAAFESRAAQIDKGIDGEVAKLRAVAPLALPKRDSAIVKGYVQKIEGTYNVERAKVDTDHAIDLLYIAYNTTPQEEGEIRVKISAIMDKLIEAQSDSTRALADAVTTADNVIRDLTNALPDWLDAKDEGDADEIKVFVAKDLLKLAADIKSRATRVETKLNQIAKTYDQIIKDTTTASDASEKALAERLADQAAIRAEIAESEAESKRLESLVADLKESFKTFEARAKEYQTRAETAEQRAFIMQIVKIGAQVISSAMPAIAMALGAGATGGASVVAAGAMSTLSQATGAARKNDPDADTTAKVIKTKTEISKTKAKYEAAEKKTQDSKDKVDDLRKDLKKAQEAAGKPVEAGAAKETEENPADGAEINGVKGRLKDAKKALTENEKESQKLADTLAGLQAGLNALAQGLGELSKEQKDEAASLRELQMKMLDKAEAYEKERREQAASLVKINALLKGKLSKEETIKLAIKSLNISVSALKRTKEIVEEIAFFFKSFADFMHQVAEDAKNQIELSESAAASEGLKKHRLAQTIVSTDGFFLRQAAEWHAANIVSEHFNRSFSEGHSKLNRLRGDYVDGDALKTYLAGAAVRLKEIADARENAAKTRLADLAQYRKQLRDELVREDVA